ncbi:MAG: BrnA antitoxin family protein [Fibromonadales bacterium]|nr:BrnA antitoxin family protein [Fibromonadales bacterium]
MAKLEIIDDAELNALGRHFDKCGEDEAEWGEAFSPADFGCSNAVEAARKHMAETDRKMYSFRLPISVVDNLKRKAKAQHKPYQRFVNEVLARAAL